MHSNKKSARSRLSRTDNQDEDSLSSHLALQQLDDANNDDPSVSNGHSTVADYASEHGAAGGAVAVDGAISVTEDKDVTFKSSLPSSAIAHLPYTASSKNKKRSKFWGFLKRGRRSATLPKCVETGEDEAGSVSAEVSSCFSRRVNCHSTNVPWTASRRRGSPDPESPTPGNVHRLSMGAGSRSFGMLNGAQLLAVVPPVPFAQTLTDGNHPRVVFGRTSHELDLRLDDTASNAIGYPHLHFSQSLSSSSSSSSSSGISVPLLPAPSTPDYPPLSAAPPTVHTQVDYMHCLVPDLLELTNCCFYWGVMDRYEAERLLEGRPEGTFLVRDSAQEEFLFSVSFRRYGRSLHARIEQWHHKFSFDSHDPDVFAAQSVCALVEHYKDPAACMFFEPMLTLPLPRLYAFTLQHLCRAVICSRVNYDDISTLHLPRQLQEYLKYYHYKQRICVRRFEAH